MNFGGDTNASTSFDRTLYLLELPNTRAPTLAEGFQVLADYAGGLLLQPREIDAERGVVLSEMRTRDSVEYRTGVAGYEFELGTTLFPQRLPIGIKDVLERADRPAFTDFYDTWYRPELMTVLVVGDIDPAAVVEGPSVIGVNSRVEAGAHLRPYTVLGADVVVKPDAYVERSVVHDHVYLGPS